MNFHNKTVEIFIPDNSPIQQAFSRTTHLAIAAHQDDIELFAVGPVLECYRKSDKWFTGVILTDGRGSPRNGIYKDLSDDEMRSVRYKEQKKAALIGEYSAVILLDYPSSVIKDSSRMDVVDDILVLLKATRPKNVYTHNLADKHDSHVASVLRVIQSIRRLPQSEKPEKLYGCSVWRSLDWVLDNEKVITDLSSHKNLQTTLLEAYDSQIKGGKRYDLAALGHRRANATFYESHEVDSASGLSYSMDLTPLIIDHDQDVIKYVEGFIQRFATDVANRIELFQ